MSTPIQLRVPTGNAAPSTANQSIEVVEPFPPPSIEQLEGTWHVTHSTLPMWKKNHNVQITYTPRADGNIDDLVTYSPADSDKVKTVKGVDKSATNGYTYNWRGKGWLMIASSTWEVIGLGEEEAGGNQWAVTYFQKTLFTPAGIDLYSRSSGGLREETVQSIKLALAEVRDDDLSHLSKQIFVIPRKTQPS